MTCIHTEEAPDTITVQTPGDIIMISEADEQPPPIAAQLQETSLVHDFVVKVAYL